MPAPASVPGSETTHTPRREQMRAPVEASRRAGHSVSLTLWYPRMRESATSLEAVSGFAWKPESGPAACRSEGLLSFESRPERMGPEEGVMLSGWYRIQVTYLCVAASFFIVGR